MLKLHVQIQAYYYWSVYFISPVNQTILIYMQTHSHINWWFFFLASLFLSALCTVHCALNKKKTKKQTKINNKFFMISTLFIKTKLVIQNRVTNNNNMDILKSFVTCGHIWLIRNVMMNYIITLWWNQVSFVWKTVKWIEIIEPNEILCGRK